MSKLFNHFEKISLQEWNKKIIKDLKSADYREKLIASKQGIEINPIYSEESIEKIHSINFPSDWISFQEIDATNTKTAIQRALLALNNDVNNLIEGKYVCIRRANDLSQKNGFIPSPKVGIHNSE